MPLIPRLGAGRRDGAGTCRGCAGRPAEQESRHSDSRGLQQFAAGHPALANAGFRFFHCRSFHVIPAAYRSQRLSAGPVVEVVLD